MERNNQLIITAWQRDERVEREITLRNPRTTMAGWRWDGTALTHPAKGTPRLVFTPEMVAQIEDALAAVTPQRTEKRYGFQIDPNDSDGWEFSHVEHDAHGVYYRTTPGVGKTVAFGKQDVVEGA